MAISNPFLLFWNRETGEELVAPDWSRWNVEDASEDVCDFKPQKTEGHICETLTLLCIFDHAWI
jgi:hypothetical protein